MLHCTVSQRFGAIYIAIFFVFRFVSCKVIPEASLGDPYLDHRKQKLLETGHVYVGNVNSPYLENNSCNHTACDWDPLSRHMDPKLMKDSSMVSQTVLADGSRFVRKEAKLSNTASQVSAQGPSGHKKKPTKMNRRLLEVCDLTDLKIV